MPNLSRDTDQLYFRLCSDHLSIEAIPKKSFRINLTAMKDHPLTDHELLMWTPHFIVAKNPRGHEITLRADGRMIVRKAGSESAARDAAADLMKLLLRRRDTFLRP